MSVALVTGASRGFGLALANALADRGWTLVVDARGARALEAAAAGLRRRTDVLAVAGDVADPVHRGELLDVVQDLGGLDLLVNNAGILGPSPLPAVADLSPDALERLMRVNVAAPLALTQVMLPALTASGGALVNIGSDAGREVYADWGGYGASKAALAQLTLVLSVERPDLDVYLYDPGDMRTAMHQDAFPGEDISDRPEPGESVPGLLALVDGRPPSGAYRFSDLAVLR